MIICKLILFRHLLFFCCLHRNIRKYCTHGLIFQQFRLPTFLLFYTTKDINIGYTQSVEISFHFLLEKRHVNTPSYLKFIANNCLISNYNFKFNYKIIECTVEWHNWTLPHRINSISTTVYRNIAKRACLSLNHLNASGTLYHSTIKLRRYL